MGKLLNIVAPDVAYFGQKDAQQVVVIRRMVRDLDLPVRIAIVPTVREPDGLALSSRNARLGAEDRERALALRRGLDAAHASDRGRRAATPPRREAAGRAAMAAAGVRARVLRRRRPGHARARGADRPDGYWWSWRPASGRHG